MDKTETNPVQFLLSLPNAEQLKKDLSHLHTAAGTIIFLCYNIHTLRKINRTYGREAGDALLCEIAQWTTGFPGGRPYRIEGDQFCIVFHNIELGDVCYFANNMESRLGSVWHLSVAGEPFDIFAQASIAVLGDLDCDYDTEFLDIIEQALEISRDERRVTVFNAEHDKLSREHVRLQMRLKHCIFSGMTGFMVYYQPLVDPVSGTWRGLEALCRWTCPSIGPVTPSIFIEEAEKMGLAHELGRWVLNTALETCKALQLDKLDRFFLSINISALQISKQDYAQTVLDALEKHNYPAAKLLLEITESTEFSFNEQTRASLEILRGKEVLFALDDFGSGYSGLSNLKNLPVDILKTDKNFIEDIEHDNYLQYFYYIMSETVHAADMRLIAKGVETKAQLQSVVKNGVDLVQGYLFGQPMDSHDIQLNIGNFTIGLDAFSGWMKGPADFNHWIHSQSAYSITPSLFGLQSKCIGIVLDEADNKRAINKMLEAVGLHFKINRVYVFLREAGTIFNNRYEWCAEGVVVQKDLFRNVDGSLDSFYQLLLENELVIATNPDQFPHALKHRLETGRQEASVKSLMVMPMKQSGEIIGFVGFDHGLERDWLPEELIILNTLCLLLAKTRDR